MSDKLLVTFYKDGISMDVVVHPLRSDEAIGIAKAEIGLKMDRLGCNVDAFLYGASATISTPPNYK